MKVFGFKAQSNSFIITFSCLCLSGLRSSGTIIVYIHIRYTSYTLKRQPSSTVIGKQKVNRFFAKFFCIDCLTTVKALTLPMVAQNKKIALVERV